MSLLITIIQDSLQKACNKNPLDRNFSGYPDWFRSRGACNCWPDLQVAAIYEIWRTLSAVRALSPKAKRRFSCAITSVIPSFAYFRLNCPVGTHQRPLGRPIQSYPLCSLKPELSVLCMREKTGLLVFCALHQAAATSDETPALPRNESLVGSPACYLPLRARPRNVRS